MKIWYIKWSLLYHTHYMSHWALCVTNVVKWWLYSHRIFLSLWCLLLKVRLALQNFFSRFKDQNKWVWIKDKNVKNAKLYLQDTGLCHSCANIIRLSTFLFAQYVSSPAEKSYWHYILCLILFLRHRLEMVLVH